MKTKIQCYSKPIAFFSTALFVLATFAQTMELQPVAYNQMLQSSSLLFMENKGQVADAKGKLRPDILFTAINAGAKLYLAANAIHYQFTKTEYPKGYDLHKREPAKDLLQEAELQKQIKTSTHRFSLELQGANPNPAITTEQQSKYTENYYLAHCPNGITGVHGYEKITCKNVYPNIDWVIYSKGGFMEYDFVVHPGGDASSIKLKVKDAESVAINAAGELIMKTSLGEVREMAPVSYADGSAIETHFKQLGDGSIGFNIASHSGKELRIDPSVVWATYYGGGGDDQGHGCAVDNNDNVYLTGQTTSTTGIASGGFQNSSTAFGDAFLVKFNSSGNRLWATYYGGSGADYGRSCIADNGNIYMAGFTSSSSVISSGGFQNSSGGGNDAILVKFTSTGTRIWGTFYGGSGEDDGYCCSLDNNGNIYLAGATYSTTAIASGGFQNSFGGGVGYDAFLVKFSSTGNRIWATYYGGNHYDYGFSCATDGSGNIYLVGHAASTSNIASGGFQSSFAGGTYDCFIVKFDSSGNRVWGTYYGGSSDETAFGCATDNYGNLYLAGRTSSFTDIASGGYQNTCGGGTDAFLVKFNGSGNRLWGTYYGGESSDYGFSCAVNNNDEVYLTGETSSETGIASNGFQNSRSGLTDVYLVKFSSSGSRIWGTYYGGTQSDYSYGCTVDANSSIYVAGYTVSPSGIAYGGHQNAFGGSNDAILAKIEGSGGILPVTLASITAYQQADNILVEWAVQQETHIKLYEIEKSFDGYSFTKAGEKTANNFSKYEWLDVHPSTGNNFYRLRIIGIDGVIKYSQIVKVIIGKFKSAFEVYPNPIIGNSINLSFINQPKGSYTIRLFKALPQMIRTQKLQHNGGSSAVSINANNISKGSYILEVIAPGNKRQSFKIVY